MLPATGSTRMQAISPRQRVKASATAVEIVEGRLHGQLANASGTPGEPGIPSVATPLPAPTSSASAWPW